MTISLVRSGDATATWVMPVIYTGVAVEMVLTQVEFSAMPPSRLKSMLTAPYANIEQFELDFGLQGGTVFGNGFNFSDDVPSLPDYPLGKFPSSKIRPVFYFDWPGFVGDLTIFNSLAISTNFGPSPDAQMAVTVALGHSASK